MSRHKFLERRGWDSNPRYAINVHTLSKRVPTEDKIRGKNGHGHNMDIK